MLGGRKNGINKLIPIFCAALFFARSASPGLAFVAPYPRACRRILEQVEQNIYQRQCEDWASGLFQGLRRMVSSAAKDRYLAQLDSQHRIAQAWRRLRELEDNPEIKDSAARAENAKTIINELLTHFADDSDLVATAAWVFANNRNLPHWSDAEKQQVTERFAPLRFAHIQETGADILRKVAERRLELKRTTASRKVKDHFTKSKFTPERAARASERHTEALHNAFSLLRRGDIDGAIAALEDPKLWRDIGVEEERHPLTLNESDLAHPNWEQIWDRKKDQCWGDQTVTYPYKHVYIHGNWVSLNSPELAPYAKSVRTLKVLTLMGLVEEHAHMNRCLRMTAGLPLDLSHLMQDAGFRERYQKRYQGEEPPDDFETDAWALIYEQIGTENIPSWMHDYEIGHWEKQPSYRGRQMVYETLNGP